MSDDPNNPYAAPQANTPAAPPQTNLDPVTQKKVEAIVKDAGQFWLAILMCIVCSALGSIIIGPWYLVRLLQWSSLAKSHPVLMTPDSPRGSLPQKFQSAKIKLIIGILFGGLIFIGVALLFVVSFVAASAAAQ